ALDRFLAVEILAMQLGVLLLDLLQSGQAVAGQLQRLGERRAIDGSVGRRAVVLRRRTSRCATVVHGGGAFLSNDWIAWRRWRVPRVARWQRRPGLARLDVVRAGEGHCQGRLAGGGGGAWRTLVPGIEAHAVPRGCQGGDGA